MPPGPQAWGTAHTPLVPPPPAATLVAARLACSSSWGSPAACPVRLADLSDEEPQSGSDFDPGAGEDSGSDFDLEAEEEPQPKKKATPRKRAAPKKKGERWGGVGVGWVFGGEGGVCMCVCGGDGRARVHCAA